MRLRDRIASRASVGLPLWLTSALLVGSVGCTRGPDDPPSGLELGCRVQAVRLASDEPATTGVLPLAGILTPFEVVEVDGAWVLLRGVYFDLSTKSWVGAVPASPGWTIAPDDPDQQLPAWKLYAAPQEMIWVDTRQVTSFVPRDDIPRVFDD